MINYRRVRRIKNAIYAFIVLLLILPLILMVVVCVTLFRISDKLDFYFGNAAMFVSATVTDETDPTAGGYALPLEQQGATEQPGEDDTSQTENPVGDVEETGDSAASGVEPEADELPPAVAPSVNTYNPEQFPDLRFDTVLSPASPSQRTIYLTFDNTPSAHLDDILTLLDRHDAKATFFVWHGEGTDTPSRYNAIVGRGHAIGIHSYSNTEPYSQLYSSVDYYLSDFSAIFEAIYQETGVRTRLYRLPGGSIHPGLPQRQAVIRDIKAELDSRGFLQYDWTVSAQDAVSPPLSKEQVLENIYQSWDRDGLAVVLCHDGPGAAATVEALEEFILRCQQEGYDFQAISDDTKAVSFLDPIN